MRWANSSPGAASGSGVLSTLVGHHLLAWADAYRKRNGKWPKPTSGSIDDAPRETWSGVHAALSGGIRGLQGTYSLPRLLAEHRGVRNIRDLSHLSVAQILAWADSHVKSTENSPKKNSGWWPTSVDSCDSNSR